MLRKIPDFPFSGPVTLVVMDGVGLAPAGPGNAVDLARTPTLDKLMNDYPCLKLKAHGTAVGLPSDDDMGNSEVGHNALGAGQIFAQGAKLVSESIATGKIFASGTWKELTGNCVKNQSTLHFLGLFSDGNVHAHIDHLKALIEHAKTEGVKRVRVHILLDGRDVGETSALEYVEPFEAFLDAIRDEHFDICIASGGGRMQITMDRYEANWDMVRRGWETHVCGRARGFASATEAIKTLRAETGAIDQDLDPFVIVKDGKPVGTINDGDSVIFYNFRGDRAIEISRAFEDENLNTFARDKFPRVLYAGMLEYDGDLHIPSRYLVNPPEITNTLGEALASERVTQYAISETQKYGHVTYFWNGNRSGKYDENTETYVEVPSDVVPFEQRPWMKCAEITDQLIEAIKSGKYRFLRCNFPNGDMVGHTGSLNATIVGLEGMDLCLKRILDAVDEAGGVAIITADHGNADEMYEISKKTGEPAPSKDGGFKAKTSHTLNPVPCVIYNKNAPDLFTLKDGAFGLSNVASVVSLLLGYTPMDVWNEAFIELK